MRDHEILKQHLATWEAAGEPGVGGYVTEMRLAGLRERTILHRVQTLNTFASFVKKPLAEVSRDDIVAYLTQPHLAPESRENYRAMLHHLFGYLHENDFVDTNPMRRIPRIKGIRQPEANPLSTAQVQQLLDSGIYARTRSYVILAAYQGLRAQEIANIRGEDIDWEYRRIYIAKAKGGHTVWRPMHSVVWAEAQKYPRTGYWFPSASSPDLPMTSRAVSDVLSKALARAGIVGHRPHQLRAWHATEIMTAGADTMIAQYSMRHVNQTTLQRYVRPDNDRIREAMERLPEVVIPARSGRRIAAVE